MTNTESELGRCLQWACSPRGGNNFYGRVLNGCGLHATPGLGTCGVTLDKKGRYVLLWDPAWFAAQDEAFRLLVIVHEAAHLILRHIERGIILQRLALNTNYSAKIKEVLNIAMDMAVNDLALRPMVDDNQKNFKTYRKELIWPESRGYSRGLTAEEYYVLLIQDLKKHGWSPQDSNSEDPQQTKATGNSGNEQPDEENGKGDGEENGKGDGEGRGKLPSWFKDLLNKKHKAVDWNKTFENLTDSEIQRAMDRARREARRIAAAATRQTIKARGVIPGCIKSTIDELLEDPSIPWQEVLRGQLRSAISQKLDESTAYPSVALLHSAGYEPYPGYQNNFTFNILAAFDTSASMSTDDFIDCCTELRGLLQTEEGVTVRLLHFDCTIQHVEDLTSDDAKDMSQSNTRYGYGGTSFNGPLRYAARLDTAEDWIAEAYNEDPHRSPFDLMLIFTDGYAPVPLPALDPQIPLFWVLTARGDAHAEMKLVLRMED